MDRDGAMALLSLFVTGALGVIGHVISSAEEKAAKRSRDHVIDVYSQGVNPADAKHWFRRVLPPEAPRESIGGRLWVKHPVRVNGDMYYLTSSSPTGLYVVCEDNMVGYIPWSEMEDIYVSLGVEQQEVDRRPWVF